MWSLKALNWKPDAIMLDNFNQKILKNINKIFKDTTNTIIEASGGISEKTLLNTPKQAWT